jgi:hypothetical protein
MAVGERLGRPLGEAIGAGDLVLRAAFDDDGGDDETGLGHPADAAVSAPPTPPVTDAYVLRDPMPMS